MLVTIILEDSPSCRLWSCGTSSLARNFRESFLQCNRCGKEGMADDWALELLLRGPPNQLKNHHSLSTHMCAQFSYKMSLTCTRYSNYIFSILCFPIFVWSIVLIQELYFLVLTIHHCHFYATLYWCQWCKTPQQYYNNKFCLLYSCGACTLSSLPLFPVLKKQTFMLTGPRQGKNSKPNKKSRVSCQQTHPLTLLVYLTATFQFQVLFLLRSAQVVACYCPGRCYSWSSSYFQVFLLLVKVVTSLCRGRSSLTPRCRSSLSRLLLRLVGVVAVPHSGCCFYP
jgi:hypothetical protein